MAEKLTTLAKRIRPFIAGQIAAQASSGAFMQEGPDIDLVGNIIGRGGDTILLFDSGGAPVAEYAATDAGLTAALAAATAGDVVQLPAGTIAGNHTVPADVMLLGYFWNSSLSGTTTNNGMIAYVNITGTLTNGDLGTALYMLDQVVAGIKTQRTLILTSEGYSTGTGITAEGTGVTGTEGGAYLSAIGKYEGAVQLQCTDSTALKQFYRWNSISDVLKAQLINETTDLVIRDLLVIDDVGNHTLTGGITILGHLFYNAKIGGCVGDGVTDDTTALQTLINTATANGTRSATIYFPPGTYLIGGALQDTGAGGFNGQILLPEVVTTDPQITVRLIGANRPPFQWSGTAIPTGYAIIKSTLAGATGNASFISGGNAANNISPVIENLIFLVPDNPTMSCLNLAYCQGGSIRNVMVTTPGGFAGTPVEPTNSNAYGVKMPGKYYANYTNVEALSVGQYYTCVLDGELTIYKGLILGNCIVCVEVPETAYPSLFISVQFTGFQYGFRGTGIHYFDVLNYCAEHSNAPAWRQTVYDLDDASNYLHGHIRYQNGVTGGAIDHTFAVNGGSNMIVREIGANVVNLDADASPIFDMTADVLGLDVQNANTVFAGPTTGAANEPTFRALVAADLSGSMSLDDLSDVVITSPADMAPLLYDSGTSKWIDGSIAMHEHIYNEDHSADCDGTEDTFTTLLAFRDNSICAYLNGVRQLLYTDYNEGAGSVVFTTPPEAGDKLIFDYIVSYDAYASIGALLLETGDYLLTELGDNLLLE